VSIRKILGTIQTNKTFLISTHVNPDADGLTSELVLAMCLKSLGKKVHIINADKALGMYLFLPKKHLLKELRHTEVPYDVAIILDCGDLDRIGPVQSILRKGKPLINIDHHITNDYFGDINFVDPHASSTAEILFDLVTKAKFKLTKEVAVLLYVGIMTDTGSFRYDNTTARTHAVVSQLMKFRFSANEWYRKIYENIPFSDFELFNRVVRHFEVTHQGRVASLVLRENILHRFSEEFDLKDRIFTFLRSINGIEVIVIFAESKKNETRVNFRSQGRIDVAQLASLYKGGGHKKASGCLLAKPMESAKRKVFEDLKRILR